MGKRKKEKFLDRMERKYGKYEIHDLMKYMSAVYIAGFIFSMVDKDASIYMQYFSLDLNMILKGQVWRLVTFLFRPEQAYNEPLDVLFFAIIISLYLMIGRQLESVWGSFRFNMYYFSGIIFIMIGSLLAQFIFRCIGVYGVGIFGGEAGYMSMTMLLAFATIFPDAQLLLFFVIPIKVKWLGIFYGAVLSIRFIWEMAETVFFLVDDNKINALYCFAGAVMLLFSMINFLIYFISNYNRKGVSRIQKKKSMEHKKNIIQTMSKNRHKCSVCGKTEKDDDTLEFRYCSRCEGNHEYCMEHLFTHEHVKKFVIDINKDIRKNEEEDK